MTQTQIPDQQYLFQESRKAVQEYTNQMTGGKILLTPLT